MNLQLSKKQEFQHPALRDKLEKMAIAKAQIVENQEKNTILGGPKKPLRTTKKIIGDTFETQYSDVFFINDKNYRKEEADFKPSKKIDVSTKKDFEVLKNGFHQVYKDFEDHTAPLLYGTATIKEPLRERKGCKRIHPVKNVSYDIQDCIEHPDLLKRTVNNEPVKTGKRMNRKSQPMTSSLILMPGEGKLPSNRGGEAPAIYGSAQKSGGSRNSDNLRFRTFSSNDKASQISNGNYSASKRYSGHSRTYSMHGSDS